jgi:cleavage and polyadenylation specificity factor subunit 1
MTDDIADLSLSQIIPMLDEETGLEPRIVSASIADPFLLLVRDDSSVYVAQIDKNNELEEAEKDDALLVSTKWLTGSLYIDSNGVFAQGKPEKGSHPNASILMFLLSASGALYVRILVFCNLPCRC